MTRTSAVKKTATHIPVWQDSAHTATGLTSIMTAGVHADRASKVRALAKQERLRARRSFVHSLGIKRKYGCVMR